VHLLENAQRLHQSMIQVMKHFLTWKCAHGGSTILVPDSWQDYLDQNTTVTKS